MFKVLSIFATLLVNFTAVDAFSLWLGEQGASALSISVKAETAEALNGLVTALSTTKEKKNRLTLRQEGKTMCIIVSLRVVSSICGHVFKCPILVLFPC